MTHQAIAALAHTIWEEQGRPDGLHAEHWREAERRLGRQAQAPHQYEAGSKVDTSGYPDAAGKPSSASSRQQTVVDQEAQTGSPQLDKSLSK